MKSLKKKRNFKIKPMTIQSLVVVLIIFGVWLSSVNIMKYAKGYFVYHSDNRYNQTDEIPKSNKANINQAGNLVVNTNIATEDTSKQIEKKQVLYSERPEIGDEIGELYIPKLNATIPIYEGTSDDELEKGVGHFADSVLPGEKDNSVLSGHRDTVFRKLGEVGAGDLLIVRTSAGEFEYKVSKVRIVDKDDRTVIVPKPRATLTVSTCYPFEYIGSAPERYILVAYLASYTLY